MPQMKMPAKFITILVLIIWASLLPGAQNLLINQAELASVGVLDTFQVSFEFGAGESCATIEVWLDLNKNELIDPAIDFMLFNSANEGEKFCDGDPDDKDGLKNGAYQIIVDEFFPLAPARFILKVIDPGGSDTAVLDQIQRQSPYSVQGAVVEPPKIANLLVSANPENQSNPLNRFRHLKASRRSMQADDGNNYIEIMTLTDSTGKYFLFLPVPQPMNWIIRSYDMLGKLDRKWVPPAPMRYYVDGMLQEVNFKYRKSEAWISGKVTDEKMTFLQTQDGKNFEVWIFAQERNSWNSFETQTRDGIFVLPVMAGTYDVNVGFEAPDFLYPVGKQNIVVQPGDSLTAIDFVVYHANAKITGKVTENGNIPLSGVEIQGFNPQTGSARNYSNDQGFYELRVSDKGPMYQVELSQNYIPGHLQVEGGNMRQVPPGSQNVNFNLVPRGNDDAPDILKIHDINPDQGLQVRVIWQASGLDFEGNHAEPIGEYGVWRGVPRRQSDTIFVQLSKNKNYKMLQNQHEMLADVRNAVPGSCYLLANDSLTLWDFITRVPAIRLPQYAVVAPTLGDSSATGIFFSFFMISAHTQNSNRFFFSNIARGYSIDNLHPPAPVVFGQFAENKVELTWDVSPHPDVIRYNIYRSDSHGFQPDEKNCLGYTPENKFTDPKVEAGQTYYYRIEAVDDATNGALSDEIGVTTTKVDQEQASLPREYSLLPNYPNPFNSGTEFQLTLPRDDQVEIGIYNLLGAEIIRLVQGPRTAGVHKIYWNGQNQPGQAVASGIYIYKMKTSQKTFTRKMLLLR